MSILEFVNLNLLNFSVYNSNNNGQFSFDQNTTPTVQNQMQIPAFQMDDANMTPTPASSGRIPDFHPNSDFQRNRTSSSHQPISQNNNNGVLGSPVLPEDLCDELVDLLYNKKQTHL